MKCVQSREIKTCEWCEIKPEGGVRFSHCSRCKVVVYCSKSCQKQHWRNGHKDTCQRLSKSQDSQDTAKKAANKTVGEGPSEVSKKKPDMPPSSSEPRAAAEEQNQNQKPYRRVTAGVDATGAPLSFGKGDNCAICLDNMRNPIRLPACGHWYCKECVEHLRQAASAQDSCPVCREPLPPGPGRLFDKAVQKYLRVLRQLERLGEDWSNLPRELQREMDDVRELFEQAADQNHADAQSNLGFMYDQGQGVVQDWTKAREWFELAAAQGHAPAISNIGLMYLTGMGTEQDLNEAMRWFLKAKSHGADVTRQVGAVMEVRKMQNVHHSHKTRIPEPTPGADQR